MNKNQLVKGKQLELTTSTSFTSLSVNYVEFNGEAVGIGLYVGNADRPESAIVIDKEKGKIVLDELNSGHPHDTTGKLLLEEYFRVHFS